jgi:hypothetical protein
MAATSPSPLLDARAGEARATDLLPCYHRRKSILSGSPLNLVLNTISVVTEADVELKVVTPLLTDHGRYSCRAPSRCTEKIDDVMTGAVRPSHDRVLVWL